jgi:hypothetical protein
LPYSIFFHNWILKLGCRKYHGRTPRKVRLIVARKHKYKWVWLWNKYCSKVSDFLEDLLASKWRIKTPRNKKANSIFRLKKSHKQLRYWYCSRHICSLKDN